MNYTYDATADALYISLADGPPEHQVEMPDGTILDIDADNRLVGVDVMTPAAGWDAEAVILRWVEEPAVAGFLRALAEWTPPTGNLASEVRTSGQGSGPEALGSAA